MLFVQGWDRRCGDGCGGNRGEAGQGMYLNGSVTDGFEQRFRVFNVEYLNTRMTAFIRQEETLINVGERVTFCISNTHYPVYNILLLKIKSL